MYNLRPLVITEMRLTCYIMYNFDINNDQRFECNHVEIFISSKALHSPRHVFWFVESLYNIIHPYTYCRFRLDTGSLRGTRKTAPLRLSIHTYTRHVRVPPPFIFENSFVRYANFPIRY